ncbi:MFS transporter [Novosphingobium umbonatum]|uniref:MFS transporter n=1 Tax=Novosphingobium umbonatum TaxID=1908524 RepID=A0A437NAP4_9SPHN|nr:MFS transporter [Novosphingobium umbonatum]RVU06966.1 MFS transporter [Novosphingobium umbonatum]
MPSSSPLHPQGGDSLAHALTTTTLVQIIATATALALPPIAPRVAQALGVDAHYIGFQISLIYLAGTFGSATSGTLLHRYSAVVVEVASLALFALGLGLLALARLDMAVVASLAIGLGYGLQNPASSQILGRVCPPEKRGLVFSVKQAGVPLGAVVSSLALPVLDQGMGWRWGLVLFMAAPLALIAHLLWHHRHERHRGKGGVSFLRGFVGGQQAVWSSRRLRVLSALGLLYSGVQLSLSAFLVLMLVENQGWPLVRAAAVGGLLQACGAVGRVSWGWLADRSGQGMALLAVIGVGSAAGLIACPWLDLLPLAAQMVVLGFLGFCLSGWNGVCMSEIARSAAAQDTGRVMGGALVYTFIGVMIGPAAYALIFERLHRYDSTFVVVSLAMLAGASITAWQAWRENNAPAKLA